MTSISDPLVGLVLDGRYRITRRLARGGMATVYEAVDARLTRTVAVKVMHVGLGDDAEFARKFDREARAAARLSHPQVVAVFDQGADDIGGQGRRPYIVMEYVEGQTLRDVIGRDGAMPPLRALDLIEPVVRAVAAAHDAGLVHRDIKPENVLISDQGQIKVADFGLAKAITSQTSTATQGVLIGTVSYLPPELVVTGKADARSDVYSLGVVLFELLTGRKPHTGETPIQVAYAHVHNDVPAPSGYRTVAPIPPYLDALVARMSARRPEFRPHDARVLLAHIHRVQGALRDGLPDDPQLTADLALPSNPGGIQAVPGNELTQPIHNLGDLVPGAAPAAGPAGFAPSIEFVEVPPATPVSPSPAPPTLVSPAVLNDQPVRPVRSPASPEYRRARTPRTPSVFDAGPPTLPQPAVQETTRTTGGPGPSALAQQRRAARRRRRGIVILLLVLALTTGVAVTAWYLVEGRFTTAPDLTRMTKDQATRAVQNAGLAAAFGETYSEDVPKGQVVSTDPEKGSRILDGSELTVLLSRGPERYAMPKIIGLSEEKARMALIEANLAIGEVAGRWDEKADVGIVLEASEKKGAALKKQTPIDLVVSKGPKPIKIENFTGDSAKKAERELSDDGFKVKIVSEHSDTVAEGLVIKQSPDSGSGHKGDSITLTKSLGPILVTVPNVVRLPEDQARQIMRDAGFEVVVKPAPINFLNLGYVAYTDPKERSKAPKGSTITLYLI
ncbi:Stk1 family PASTA domain-containing Ser/Thr kinase [Microlunatus parietis]|nr:Stk1 family PASTA domain-containing Ser/Thr kinase [Microlunatus parietis]